MKTKVALFASLFACLSAQADPTCPQPQQGAVMVVTQDADPRMHVLVCEGILKVHADWVENHPHTRWSPRTYTFYCSASETLGALVIGDLVYEQLPWNAACLAKFILRPSR